MECFSYKGGYGMHLSRRLKEKLAWATDKRFWVISIAMLVITVIYYPETKQ